MSAREDILASVRAALVDADGPTGPTSPIAREYRSTRVSEDPVALFAERVADYQARVRRCPIADVPEAIHELLAGRRIVVPEDLPWEVPGATVDAGLSPQALDRFDGVVTTAALGIALTGTIVLDHSAGQGRRALTLVPDLHVCVLSADQIVPTVPDAFRRLDPRRPQTWISGPSATSDIELSRVEGVHGPRELTVVLAE